MVGGVIEGARGSEAELDVLPGFGGFGGATHALESAALSTYGKGHPPPGIDLDLEEVEGRLEGCAGWFGNPPGFLNRTDR